MNLTQHFTKEELIYSDTAKKCKINNEPNEIQLKVLKHTCEYLLEPLRKLLNQKYITYCNKSVDKVVINITSGFRCASLNKKVGGATTSQHLNGSAVDFEVVLKFKNGTKFKLPYTEVFSFIKRYNKAGKLSVDQCILEHSGTANWVHISYHPSGKTLNRNEFLIYNNGKYVKA